MKINKEKAKSLVNDVHKKVKEVAVRVKNDTVQFVEDHPTAATIIGGLSVFAIAARARVNAYYKASTNYYANVVRDFKMVPKDENEEK